MKIEFMWGFVFAVIVKAIESAMSIGEYGLLIPLTAIILIYFVVKDKKNKHQGDCYENHKK